MTLIVKNSLARGAKAARLATIDALPQEEILKRAREEIARPTRRSKDSISRQTEIAEKLAAIEMGLAEIYARLTEQGLDEPEEGEGGLEPEPKDDWGKFALDMA